MERGRSPLDGVRQCPQPAAITAQAKPQRRHALHSRPLLWVDRGRPGGGPGKPSKESGVGLGAKVSVPSRTLLFPNAEPHGRTGTRPAPRRTSGQKASVLCRSGGGAAVRSIVPTAKNSPTSRLIVHDRLDHGEVHRRVRRDSRHLGRHLTPMDELAGLTARTGPSSQSLRLVVRAKFVMLHQTTRVCLPSPADLPSPLHPPSQRTQHEPPPSLPRAAFARTASGMAARQGEDLTSGLRRSLQPGSKGDAVIHFRF